MTQVIVIFAMFAILTGIVYKSVGFSNIKKSYMMWFDKSYWVNYNIVEAMAWSAKAIVILPALIWQVEIWQLHFLTLCTSCLLIWASERKLLPTLVAFNTMWIGISSIVIVRNIM